MNYVKASHESPYGVISSHWKKNGDELEWDVQIPANTTAVIYLPAGTVGEVKEGKKAAAGEDGVRFVKMDDAFAVFEIGSGKYSFVSPIVGKKLTKSNP